MKKALALTICAVFLFSLSAYASVGTQVDGEEAGAAVCLNWSTGLDQSGGTVKTITVDNTETSFIGADLAGAKNDPYKKTTTDQTIILATESGRIFICMQNTKFQLPTAADGLTYTFVTGSNVEVEVQVATTPTTIVFAPPEIGNGNGVIETAGTNTTGNTVTLYCDGTDWYVSVPYSGTERWTDGGEWTQLDLGAQS